METESNLNYLDAQLGQSSTRKIVVAVNVRREGAIHHRAVSASDVRLLDVGEASAYPNRVALGHQRTQKSHVMVALAVSTTGSDDGVGSVRDAARAVLDQMLIEEGRGVYEGIGSVGTGWDPKVFGGSRSAQAHKPYGTLAANGNRPFKHVRLSTRTVNGEASHTRCYSMPQRV